MTNYDNFGKTFSSSRKGMHWEEIDYILKKNPINQKTRILDVGCGNGRLLEHLEEKNIEYIGIDKSEIMLEEARKLHPTKLFLVLDMLRLEKIILKDFDYIFFIASFHHLENIKDREEVAKQAYGLLKKGGKLIMTNWNLLSGENKEKYSENKIVGSKNSFGSEDFQIKIGEHKRFYHSFSTDEINDIFEKVGYIKEENSVFKNENNIVSIFTK